MTSLRLLAGLILLAGTLPAFAQSVEPIRFARNAGIANDGRVAFTYQDDIWVVDADGTNPRRLTVNVGRDFSPRFSPDGKSIAFTSNRTGNNDVFVIPAVGGEPKQLTWHSGDDQALAWTPDGKGVVMSAQRGTNAWGSPLYVQPIDGGAASRPRLHADLSVAWSRVAESSSPRGERAGCPNRGDGHGRDA